MSTAARLQQVSGNGWQVMNNSRMMKLTANFRCRPSPNYSWTQNAPDNLAPCDGDDFDYLSQLSQTDPENRPGQN